MENSCASSRRWHQAPASSYVLDRDDHGYLCHYHSSACVAAIIFAMRPLHKSHHSQFRGVVSFPGNAKLLGRADQIGHLDLKIRCSCLTKRTEPIRYFSNTTGMVIVISSMSYKSGREFLACSWVPRRSEELAAKNTAPIGHSVAGCDQ